MSYFSYFLSVPRGWYNGHPTSSSPVGLTTLVLEARGGGGDQLQGLDSQSLVLGRQQATQVRSLETRSLSPTQTTEPDSSFTAPPGASWHPEVGGTRLLGTFQPWRAGIPCPVLGEFCLPDSHPSEDRPSGRPCV